MTGARRPQAEQLARGTVFRLYPSSHHYIWAGRKRKRVYSQQQAINRMSPNFPAAFTHSTECEAQFIGPPVPS